MEFDEDLPKKIKPSTPTFEKKDIDSIKSSTGGNNIEFEASKENSVANGNNSDSKSVLTSVPNYIESPLRQSTRTCTKNILYPRQMVYGSGSLSKISAKKPERNQSSSSKSFVSLYKAKSYKDIARILQMLSSNIDNEGVDEPTSLKEAKT